MHDEVPTLLTFMLALGLAVQLFRSLTESVSLSVCFTGLPVACNAFTHSVANDVKDTGSLYIVDKEQRFAYKSDCRKLKLLTRESEEVDCDDDDGEDVGMQTPSKKRPKASAAAVTSATPDPPPPLEGHCKAQGIPRDCSVCPARQGCEGCACQGII